MRYEEWNEAVCDCFTRRAVPGSLVYLNVDDALVETLAANQGVAREEAVSCFVDAIREKLREGRAWGNEVSLSSLAGRDENDRPRCAAFLAATVLAATRMGDDMNPLNYFGQLRTLLRFPGEGRLRGMEDGSESEEPLWQEWALFLAKKNLLSSAKAGAGGPTTYINYPISQTLLRHTDREKLKSVFNEAAFFRQEREPDLLMARIFALRQSLTPRLHQKLSTTSSERYAAWTQAITDLHEEFLRSRSQNGQNTGAGYGASVLPMEILRLPESSRRGRIVSAARFEFVVKLRVGFAFGGADREEQEPEICINGRWQALEADEENPSITCPVAELSPAQIASGCEFSLRYAGNFTKTVLPKRDFRILFKDNDHPHSGIYQTGKPSGAGLSFVFLGAAKYAEDLKRLQGIEKINWKTLEPLGETGWIQVTEGLITHEDWTHLTAGDSDLRNALRPRAMVSASISGGLRVGNGGYLPSVPPLLTVRGAAKSYPTRIIALRDASETLVWEGDVPHFVPWSIPDVVLVRPGFYRVEVGFGDETTQRLLPITHWDALGIAESPALRGPASNHTSNDNPLARMAWQEK